MLSAQGGKVLPRGVEAEAKKASATKFQRNLCPRGGDPVNPRHWLPKLSGVPMMETAELEADAGRDTAQCGSISSRAPPSRHAEGLCRLPRRFSSQSWILFLNTTSIWGRRKVNIYPSLFFLVQLLSHKSQVAPEPPPHFALTSRWSGSVAVAGLSPALLHYCVAVRSPQATASQKREKTPHPPTNLACFERPSAETDGWWPRDHRCLGARAVRTTSTIIPAWRRQGRSAKGWILEMSQAGDVMKLMQVSSIFPIAATSPPLGSSKFLVFCRFRVDFLSPRGRTRKAGRKPGRKNCKTGVGRRGDLDQTPPSSLTGRQLGESTVWKRTSPNEGNSMLTKTPRRC